MSASTGPSSKGEKGKSKYQSLDINSIYNSTRSETSESQATKSTVPRKHGMQPLGKVPQRRPPANLPSLKSENSGNDPSISLVPTGGQGWVVKSGEPQQLTPTGGPGSNTASPQPAAAPNQNVTPTPAPAVGAPPAPTQPSGPPPSHTQTTSHPHDKTWSSITGGSQALSLGVEHGPSFLAHQSPQFRQEFPSLSGEPGGAPAHPTPAYGPGPSLRPQTEPGSWSQGTHAKSPQTQTNHNNIPTPFKSVVPPFLLSQNSSLPMFPDSLQKKSRSQANYNENRMNNRMTGGGPRPLLNSNNQGGANSGEGEDFILSRPIIREEELVKMDELTRDPSWAANDDIDYNEQLSFSDGDSPDDEKEKENKLREKSKHGHAHSHTQHQQSIRDYEKKEETEKSNRDKPFMSERDRNQQAWRVGNNNYSDFRNAPPRQLIPQSARLDDEEVWKERRRQTDENKMAATEKAKQRREEEEKRYEDSRAKKNNKDSSDFHSTMTSEWDKDDRAKSSENFRQMTQFPLEPRPNMNRERDRERDMRRDRDRDSQYNSRFQNKPPRFRKNEAGKMPQFGGGFEKNWSNHNSFGRRGGPDEARDKDDDYRKDRHNDRVSLSDSGSDRFRGNMRDERNMDSNKRNYYDNSHMDYNQSSFQSNRDRDVEKDKDLNKDFDYRMSDKDSNRDVDKEWESPKGDNDSRSFEDRMRRDNKSSNDNFLKQSNDHFEEKENEWRERPQRPESRDRPERLDNRDRHDRDHRIDMRPDVRDMRNDPRLERQDSRDNNRLENRFDSRDFRSHDHRENRHDHNRHERNTRPDNMESKMNRDRFDPRDNRPENQDSVHSDIRDRPLRPDSRDSRVSRNSKDLSDKALMDGEYSIPESYLRENMERLTYKEKDVRREPIQRSRDGGHVPGPITQEKLVAYEHKHSQSQLEKSDSQEKDNDDKKNKKNESENSSQVWGESREDKSSSLQESTSKPLEPLPRNDFAIDDSKALNKGDELDKRKDNIGMRDRRDDKTSSGGGRGNRNNRGAPRSGGYSSGPKYNSYSSDRPNWQNKDNRDNRQRQGSSRGQKHWNRSESEGSGDEISAESAKDDKKTDNRKQDCSPKFGTWKDNKDKREEKKDMKSGGNESDKDRNKGDKKSSGGVNESGRKGDGGGFAPRGEPSRRGRGGGGGGMRGQSRVGMGPAMYGPPGSKPFSSSGPQSHQSSMDSQDKNSSQQSGQSNKGPRKGPGGIRSQEENWDTTSETSDGSDAKKSNKNRNKTDKKPRGAIGDKRNMLNTGSALLNGRPDSKPDDGSSEKKSNKDDSENTGYSNNGFQEVKSKKNGRDSRGGPGSGPINTSQGSNVPKDETKRSQSKGSNKEKPGGGVKGQQKSYTREFVSNKPPRMQRLDNNRKLQQQQVSSSQDVSDMNKINQSVSPLFPPARSNNDTTSNSCPPPPPAHNAWNKPINASLRTTPPLSSTLAQLTVAPAQITTDKINLEELSQPGNNAPASSPTTDKAITKITREVEKSMLEGPPVNTIIFENTNYKRDPGDIGMKQRYPIKQPARTPMDKTRERKMEDELTENNHPMGLGGFKSAPELQASEGKPQDSIQVPISFGKNEDNADMKLDFAFDTDLSQLSDDKTNQNMHVGQSSTADLNEKIASVKKVWDTAPTSMSGHVDENPTSSFTQGFTSDKSLDPSAPSHHNDHTDFNTTDSVYGSAQLSSGGGYVAAGSSMMKQDTIVSNANTMCKANMFQVSQQPQQVAVMPHPGPLSTPPPIANVLSFPGYSSTLSAVPSPPNVLYNSQQAGAQAEIYQAYSLNTAPMHGSGNRSYADFSPSNYMSQNSTFQPSMYMQSAPPSAPSVFQNPNQYRITPHGSAAISQQMNSNPNQMLMSSSSSSVVSGNQVKSTQGSMQPTAIGSKSGGAPPTAAYAPASPQILLIDPSPVSFLHQGYRPTALQHSSSYFATNSPLTGGPGASTGGLFNSSLLSSGGSGANTGNIASASPFGVQPPSASYNQQQPPSSTQPPSHHQPPAYPNQPQMTASFRNPTGYAKTGHPESVKSSSNDQYQNMFPSNVPGSPKPAHIGVVKPQPSASPQPQHKYPYNNSQSVPQSNLGYQPNSTSNGASRQQQVVGQASRYISPIQRPMGPTYSQQQHVQQQQVQAAMLQQQARQQQHRLQQPHQVRPAPPQHQSKQYYQQQGGSMKLEGNESVKNEVEEKASQDKSSKDDTNSEQ